MKVDRTEYFAAFGFIASLTLGLLLAVWAAGCGSADGFGIAANRKPRVDILCDAASCTILVDGADTITAWHDDEFYWHEGAVPSGRRYTNRDAAPAVSITVEACNEHGCTEQTAIVLGLS
jgi:hypothetical protein